MSNNDDESTEMDLPTALRRMREISAEMEEQMDRAHVKQDRFMQQWRVRMNDLTDRADGIPEREAFMLMHRMAEMQNEFVDAFNASGDQRSRDLLADFVSGCAEFYRKPFECASPRCAAEPNID